MCGVGFLIWFAGICDNSPPPFIRSYSRWPVVYITPCRPAIDIRRYIFGFGSGVTEHVHARESSRNSGAVGACSWRATFVGPVRRFVVPGANCVGERKYIGHAYLRTVETSRLDKYMYLFVG